MKQLVLIFALSALLPACSQDTDVTEPGTDPGATPGGGVSETFWSIPVDQVFDGGPGKDGIPALENLDMATVANAGLSFMEDDDLVLAIRKEGTVHLYPHPIMDWHEIANDAIGDFHFAVTYCPLTGTGIAWNRELEGEITTFGVSGLLYNSNLIPYDRLTDSNWSQMRLNCVQGELNRREAGTYNLIELPWSLARSWFPEGRVLTDNTGFQRDYDRYPYFSYRTDNGLLFPVNHEDDRLHNKERVLGVVIDSLARTYRFSAFPSEGGVRNDEFNGQALLVVGHPDDNYMAAYHRRMPDGTVLVFSWVESDGPVIAEDQEGNRWDIFGRAVSGPRAGEQLSEAPAFMGFWFSWVAFYPDLELIG